jgi:nucleotide-binding universal stress UspA family protein
MMSGETHEQGTMVAPESGVTVRMYDLHGEGDCFLLALRAQDGSARYILIDCGLFLGTSGGADRLREVAADIAGATGHHLHAVVATHEHWDHLAGFEYAKATLNGSEMTIDEVWMAWTEDVAHDALAKRLHEEYETAATALVAAVTQLEAQGSPWAGPIRDVLAYKHDFEGMLGINTGDLMDRIHTELAQNRVRYCSPESPPFALPQVPGVRFYTLGPPRDEKLLKILEVEQALRGEPLPTDRAATFYAAVLGVYGAYGLGEDERAMQARIDERSRPFGDPFVMTPEQAQSYEVAGHRFFEEHYGFGEDADDAWRRIDQDWLGTAGELALHLDDYTNNTSLVLAIELLDSGKVLLFPADAQAGNWSSWKDVSWTVEDGCTGETVTAPDLVQRTAFYKVGHHGSHNGTLLEYLRQMRADLVAMIPVNEVWAKGKKGWEHPGQEVFEALTVQTGGRIIRADTGVQDAKPPALSQSEWQAFVEDVETDADPKLWIQYTVRG